MHAQWIRRWPSRNFPPSIFQSGCGKVNLASPTPAEPMCAAVAGAIGPTKLLWLFLCRSKRRRGEQDSDRPDQNLAPREYMHRIVLVLWDNFVDGPREHRSCSTRRDNPGASLLPFPRSSKHAAIDLVARRTFPNYSLSLDCPVPIRARGLKVFPLPQLLPAAGRDFPD